MENLSSRELELVVGAVKMQIATMKTLWKGEELPAVVGDLERILVKVQDTMDYGGSLRSLLCRIEDDGQCGVIPILISEVLSEQFDDNMLRWCEYHIQQARQKRYKQTLCESESL